MINRNDPILSESSLLYRIYPKSFFDFDGDGIGDIAGVTYKLPYLRSLGADGIILTCLFESNVDYLGYGATNFTRINPAIGTIEDFDRLIEGANLLGMRVFLSLSLFTTSTQHEWFEKSKNASEYNPYREYYVRRKGRNSRGTNPPDDRKNVFGDSAWINEKPVGTWYMNQFGHDFPVLNYDNPRVRKEILDVLRFWIGKGVDGFVFDHVYSDEKATSDDASLSETEDLLTPIGALKRILTEAKEKIDAPFCAIINADSANMRFAESFLESGLASSLCIESLISGTRLEGKSAFSPKKLFSEYLDLQTKHKSDRRYLAFEDSGHQRMLSYFESNADGLALPAAKMLATLLLTSCNTPILYQGEELGMTNAVGKKSGFSSLFDKFAQTALSPFPWDNSANAGFSKVIPYIPVDDNARKINVAAEESDPESALGFYRNMIAFRKSSPALCGGSFEDYSKGDLILYLREAEGERLLIMMNASSRHANYPLPQALLSESGYCECSNYPLVTKRMHATIGLRPYEARIYRLRAPLLALS